MTTITGANIGRARLCVLKAAVKLEKLGMKRRGPSAKGIVIAELGLPKRSSHDEVVRAIEELLKA